MSNDAQPPVEAEQPLQDKSKPPFHRRSGCWSWFRTIVMLSLVVQVIISQYELYNVREKNAGLRKSLIDLNDDEIARRVEALRELREESQPPNLARRFEGDFYGTYSVTFSHDGQFLVSSHLDGIRLWDVQTGAAIRAFNGPDYFPEAVAISPDGHYIATSSWSDPTLLWDAATGEMIRQFGTRNGSRPVTSLVFSYDGRYLLTGETGGLAKLWDIEKSQPIHIYDGKINYVLSVAFSPSGQYFVMGGSDGTVSLWNVQTGDKIRSFQGHTSDVNSVAFSPDGRS
ncbi:MAG: WD40 repeat domain-containing protein, partial [Anaerolineae bacterium]